MSNSPACVPGRRAGWALLAAACASACVVTPHQRPPAEASQRFDVTIEPGDEVLELRVANGRVTISDGSAPACAVEVSVRAATKEEAERRSGAVRLLRDDDANGVRVVAIDGLDFVSTDGLHVAVAVAAPPQFAVRVLTRQAAVMVHGYRGRLTVDTDAGDVGARMAGGDVTIKSRSGEVRLSGHFAHAEVRSETGPVQVVLAPEGPPPRLEIESLAGDVTVELPQDCRVQFSARLRGAQVLPCELAAEWTEYAVETDDRWRTYRGSIGGAQTSHRAPSVVQVTSERGRVALRLLPGS